MRPTARCNEDDGRQESYQQQDLVRPWESTKATGTRFCRIYGNHTHRAASVIAVTCSNCCPIAPMANRVCEDCCVYPRLEARNGTIRPGVRPKTPLLDTCRLQSGQSGF